MSKATEMGITPAYAGKRGGQRALRFLPQDHPRVCGEKTHLLVKPVQCLGSPPRMRGKDWKALSQRQKMGITPAYAGKREQAGRRSCFPADHPRVCGEKTKKIP